MRRWVHQHLVVVRRMLGKDGNARSEISSLYFCRELLTPRLARNCHDRAAFMKQLLLVFGDDAGEMLRRRPRRHLRS